MYGYNCIEGYFKPAKAISEIPKSLKIPKSYKNVCFYGGNVGLSNDWLL